MDTKNRGLARHPLGSFALPLLLDKVPWVAIVNDVAFLLFLLGWRKAEVHRTDVANGVGSLIG